MRLLASFIMLYRCASREDWYSAWLARVEGGPEHVEPVLTAIRTLVESAVGLPDRARPADQVEALVAEHLWFFLVNVNRQADGIVSVEGPALDVTEPGGDGLVIYKDPGGQFQFRLWEIKKHTAHSRMSGTVGRAYTQLSTRATQYLAKYSLVGQHIRRSPWPLLRTTPRVVGSSGPRGRRWRRNRDKSHVRSRKVLPDLRYSVSRFREPAPASRAGCVLLGPPSRRGAGEGYVVERSLDPALLGAALGATSRLPSPEELAATISEAEISLLLGRGEVVPDLVRLGWFLHSVGSAIPSLELYGWKDSAPRFKSRHTYSTWHCRAWDESKS